MCVSELVHAVWLLPMVATSVSTHAREPATHLCTHVIYAIAHRHFIGFTKIVVCDTTIRGSLLLTKTLLKPIDDNFSWFARPKGTGRFLFFHCDLKFSTLF